MSTHTHQTAPTQFIEAAGVRFAYRRFGKRDGIPIVLNMHFTGTMDHWDPAVTDGLAKEREVILFDNAGISSSSGEVPESIEGMAEYAAAFIGALGLSSVDVLGFSIGGLVAQALTLQRPDLVRRLILVGTGPRGGEGMATLTPEAQAIFGATYPEPDHLWKSVHFTQSENSQAAAQRFIERIRARVVDRDPLVSDRVNGINDVIIYPVNSWILERHLPNAQLILYPDANHGSLFQYPELFVAHVNLFLKP